MLIIQKTCFFENAELTFLSSKFRITQNEKAVANEHQKLQPSSRKNATIFGVRFQPIRQCALVNSHPKNFGHKTHPSNLTMAHPKVCCMFKVVYNTFVIACRFSKCLFALRLISLRSLFEKACFLFLQPKGLFQSCQKVL